MTDGVRRGGSPSAAALPGLSVIGGVVTAIVERLVDMNPLRSWDSAFGGDPRTVRKSRCEFELPTLLLCNPLRQTHGRTIIPVLAHDQYCVVLPPVGGANHVDG